MKMIMIGLWLIGIIILGNSFAFAQSSTPKEISCQPSAEEILSLIKSFYEWTPPADGISIAGEVKGYGEIRLPKERRTLFQVIGYFGGGYRTQKANYAYLLRKSPENKMMIETVIDLKNKSLRTSDDKNLEVSDVIFVARGCVNEKLLPPSKRGFPLGSPNWQDYPETRKSIKRATD